MEKKFSLATGKRIYAIGDIHGYPDVLQRLHDKIDADIQARPVESARIIYLGDYIDRGPDSKGVIDIIMKRQAELNDVEHIHLMGNHEGGLLSWLKSPQGERADWVAWGGIQALQSYGVTTADEARDYHEMAQEMSDKMPATHLEFYKNLKLYHVEDDFLFVHAGIQPDVALSEQTYPDLTFTREPFLSHEGYHPYYVVHGHTVNKDRQVDRRHNRINLDSGLYQGGALSCAVIEGDTIDVIEVFK